MATKIPAFTYSGNYRTELKNGRWYIFFLTSGVLKMTYGRYGDVYLHGGGGGGGGGGYNSAGGGGGGGGWFATHENVRIEAGQGYSIIVGTGGLGDDRDGAAGNPSSAFGYSVNGGNGGEGGGSSNPGGSGGSGSGGRGGTSVGGHGSNGGGNTTYAFNDSSLGMIYGGGGGGGCPEYGAEGDGGAPYGANGDEHAVDNTGAGGGGGNYSDGTSYGGNGGSGIVILRSTQDDELPVTFNGRTLRSITFNGSEIRGLIYNGTRIFMELVGRRFERLRQKTRFALPVT